MIFKKLKLEKCNDDSTGGGMLFIFLGMFIGGLSFGSTDASVVMLGVVSGMLIGGISGIAITLIDLTFKSSLKLIAVAVPIIFICIPATNSLAVLNLDCIWSIIIFIGLIELFYWLDRTKPSSDYGKFLGIPVIAFAKKLEAGFEALLAISVLNIIITTVKAISDNWDLALDILGWTGIVLLIAGGVWAYFFLNGLKYKGGR